MFRSCRWAVVLVEAGADVVLDCGGNVGKDVAVAVAVEDVVVVDVSVVINVL